MFFRLLFHFYFSDSFFSLFVGIMDDYRSIRAPARSITGLTYYSDRCRSLRRLWKSPSGRLGSMFVINCWIGVNIGAGSLGRIKQKLYQSFCLEVCLYTVFLVKGISKRYSMSDLSDFA